MEIDQNALVILDQLRGDQRLKKVLENQSIHVLGILPQDNLDNDNHPRVVVLCRKHGTISRRRLDQAHHFDGAGADIDAKNHFRVSRKASTRVLSCSTSSME